MDRKLFFIVIVLLIDYGSPFYAEHPETADENAAESYSQLTRNEDNGVNGEIHLLEAHARPRRQATSLMAIPGTIIGGMFDTSLGMLGGVMNLFLPGSRTLLTVIESMVMRLFGMISGPFMFAARSLGQPFENMASNMLDQSKKIAVKYLSKLMVYGVNRLKEWMPTIDSFVVKYSENPDISDGVRSFLKACHMGYMMTNALGFWKPT